MDNLLTRREFLVAVAAPFAAAAAAVAHSPGYSLRIRPSEVDVTSDEHAHATAGFVPDKTGLTSEELFDTLDQLGDRMVEPFGPSRDWQYHGFDDPLLNCIYHTPARHCREWAGMRGALMELKSC